MTMGLPLRCRYWSVLQMVAIVVCYRGKVSSDISQGCVGSQLCLICEGVKVINITAVVLGDYNFPRIACDIRDNDCTRNANGNHTVDVHRRCDGQSNCTVDVLQEKIPCGLVGWTVSDFERITYDCIDDRRSTLMVEGCVGSQLSLRCPEMKVIKITAVVLGDSYLVGTLCYIRDNDCTRNANANHTMDVHRRCDGQSNCTVDVIQEAIECGITPSKSDFERITYICMADPRNYLTSTDGRLTNLYNNTKADDQTDPGPATPASNYSQALTIERVIIICLIILLAIVVLVVVMYQRKKRQQVKPPDAVKTSDLETDRKEAIDMNDAQGTSLNENAGSTFPIYSSVDSTEVEKSLNSGAKNLETPSSDYCKLQCDSEYLQLYEPIIVHEQPQVEKSLNSGENPTSDYSELQCNSEYLQLYQPIIVHEQPQ